MLNVLVAQPMRADLLPVFRERAAAIYESLTYPHKERGDWVSNGIERRPQDPPYTTNAAARNGLLAEKLQDHHTHVLWLDADLVTVPADLIERLAEVSETDVVAPLVYVELVDPDARPSLQNGGWFYDTGAFIWQGKRTHMWSVQWLRSNSNPSAADVIELDSVGTCYLIPADVYRQGARYEPRPRHIEHYSVMEAARGMGHRVLVRRDTAVEHAYLPKYGEDWHSP